MKKRYWLTKKCVDCGKKISFHAKRCSPCAIKEGKKSGIYSKPRSESQKKHTSETMKLRKINVKHGESTYQHYCKLCKKPITWRAKLCCSCDAIERCKTKEKCGGFIDGRTFKDKLCKDCEKKISYWATRCAKCSRVYNMRTMMQRGCKYYKDILMKSTWEIIYAKWLDKQNIKWEYETKTFDLGKSTYTPDFYLPETDTYVEIKGWFRPDAKKKWRLFRKLYSKINIKLISSITGLKL